LVGGVLPLLALLLASEVAAQAAPARLTTAAPTSFARGASGATMRLHGQGFVPGISIRPIGQVADLGSPVTFAPVQTISPSLAATTVRVRADAPSASYRFMVTQPDPAGKEIRLGDVTIRVTAGSSLMAPVSVTTAAIVHPLDGALLAEGDRVYPRALLGTTGSGAVSGFWELDGVPFARFVTQARAGYPVSVQAGAPIPGLGFGDHELVLRIDSPQSVRSEAVRVIGVAPKAGLLRLVAPPAGAAVGSDERGGGPTFRWTAQPGAVAYELVISPDRREVRGALRARTTVSSRRLSVRERSELPPGLYWWSVRPVFPGETAGRLAPWQELELVAPGAVQDAEEGDDAAPAPAGPALDTSLRGEQEQADAATTTSGAGRLPLLDWRLDLGGDLLSTTAEGEDESYEARLPATLTVLYEAEHAAAQASTDLSFLREIDPGDGGRQESHAWVADGRLYGRPWGLLGRAGYFGPSALAGASLLAAGLVRGGGEAGVATPAGVLRYYGSFDDSPSGTASSVAGDEQDVAVASWELPFAEQMGTVQVVALDASESGAPEAGVAAAEARSYGLVGALALGESWRLELEGAQSTLEPEAGEDLDGTAYRLAVSGQLAGATVQAGAQRTEAEYVNLASGSLSPGGIPDRTSADLSVTRPFGATVAGLTYRYATSGEGVDGTVPGASQHALAATVDAALSASLFLAASASWASATNDEPVPDAADAVDSLAAAVSLTATWGELALVPSLAWQSTRNSGPAGVELADLDVWSAGLSLSGAAGPAWTLAGDASWDRHEPGFGASVETLLVSLQPAWQHPRGYRIGPVLTGVWSDVPDFGTRRDLHAQLTVGWFPPVGSSFPVGVSVAAGWTDTSMPPGAPEPAEDEGGWSASLALSLRWGGGSPSVAAPSTGSTP
jgi:hypothetical protein